LRDNEALATTVPHAAQQFGRAIIMPNLTSPVTTTELAKSYRDRILQHIPQNNSFEPLMTLYLTDQTHPAEIEQAKQSGIIHGIKLYPAGATTNAEAGVSKLDTLYPVFESMIEQNIPLLIHGEVVSDTVDIFDREKAFIDTHLAPLIERYPDLKIVLEHITTKDAVQFIEQASDHVAATITAHHLRHNRNDMLAGGIRPHLYCLPILKRSPHQQALIEAATSGNPKFFIGTDSAPHAQSKKESPCGCAGCYTAYAAIELYAEVFEQVSALDKLENFASVFGAQFYGLPINTITITLDKAPWQVPSHYELGSEKLIPLAAKQTLQWKIQHGS